MRSEEHLALEHIFQKSLTNPGNDYLGWMCTYIPVELIHAAGFTPYRIYGIREFRNAEGYLPINFCPYLKSCLQQLMIEKENLKGMVFATSCDGSRRVYDMAVAYLPHLASHIVDIPRKINPSSIDFFKLNLEKLFDFLTCLKGKDIKGEAILDSIKQFNHIKRGLQNLRAAFLEGKVGLSDYHRVVRYSVTSDPALFSVELDHLLDSLGRPTPQSGPRLMMVGNFINEERLLKIISGLDCQLVYDDVCTSVRYFGNQINLNPKGVFYSLAQSYLSKPSCLRMADMGQKLEDIQKTVNTQDIDALVFVSLKFCDNTLYFYPLLKKELGIPILYLELEYNNFSEGQVKTRLEAFLEML